jgi:hypothetical protein
LPAPAQSPTSTPLGELLAASSAPATARPGGIRPQERSGAADWTPEEAKKFILEHDYEFSGTLECAVWAQKRAEKITGIKPPSITEYNPDQGAYNYIDIYADSVIPVTRQNAQSTLNRIEPGALLVFDRNEGGAFGSGHVAIIEKVQANGVWISHSNWPKGNPPKIEFYDTEILIGLYVIPAGAEPSPEAAIDESRRKRRQRV